MTDLRAVFDFRTGAQTTRQRIERVLGRGCDGLLVPDPLKDIVAAENNISVNDLPPGTDILLVNGRWLATWGVQQVGSLSLGSGLVQKDQQLVAARVGSPQAAQIVLDGKLDTLSLQQIDTGRPMIERPWDILAQLESTLTSDLSLSPLPTLRPDSAGPLTQGTHPVYAAPSVRFHPMVVIDCEKGPVSIDDKAIVGSFSVIAGPCHIGAGSIVAPHAHIRSVTAIGPSCVVGGEISFSVLQGHSNKSHAGFLGHSLVGQWVNLGAQTTVSNLKNTYGVIRVMLEGAGAPQSTGTNKIGPIIGDHVRTAIGSRLNTGSCVGTASLLALSGIAPKFVERFSFLTDSESATYEIDKFLGVADRMMRRRGCKLHESQQQRLRQLWSSVPH